MKKRDVEVCGEGNETAAVTSASFEMYVVATPSRWITAGPVQRGTNVLIASVESAGSSNSTGSETTSAPGATVTEPVPPKVRTWSLAGSIAPAAPSAAGFAT
jgi:hypothetical protein